MPSLATGSASTTSSEPTCRWPKKHREPGTSVWIQTIEWGPTDWRHEAVCRALDINLFFPIGLTGEAPAQIETACAICRTCGVQQQCLEFALATNQQFGIWGATSEEERRPLRRAWLSHRRRTKDSIDSANRSPVPP
jgi:WhiB family redox-sensing transcriptional regulator